MSFHAGYLEIRRPETFLVDQVRQSMASLPRALPPAFALDAVGHALYARVTSLPCYTQACAEANLIQTHRRDLLAKAGSPKEIVDLNAGTATQSRGLLHDVERYVAIESCRAVLDDAVDGLGAAFPHLEVNGIVGDPAFGLAYAPTPRDPRLLLMLNSALGKLDPTEARLELARIRGLMEPEDRLLVGVDLHKDDSRLADSYQDIGDVQGAYFRNALRRANREVGTDFRSTDWNLAIEAQADSGRVEIRFEARDRLTVDGGRSGTSWQFEKDEPLVVEHAYKPTEGQVAAIAVGAGYTVEQVWRDGAEGFALFLLAP